MRGSHDCHAAGDKMPSFAISQHQKQWESLFAGKWQRVVLCLSSRDVLGLLLLEPES